MAIFDWILCASVALLTLRGIVRGAVREATALCAVVAAFSGAFTLYPQVRPWLQGYVTPAWAQSVCAGVLIFLCIYLAVLLVGRGCARLLHRIHLGFLDRGIGALVGCAEGYSVCCALVLALLLVPGGERILGGSRLAPYTYPVLQAAAAVLPGGTRERVRRAPPPPQPPVSAKVLDAPVRVL